MEKGFRFDYVFSNWVYVWFALFFLGVVRASPLLPILAGVVCNTYQYLYFKDSKSAKWGIKYLWWNLNIKLFPALVLLCSGNRIRWKSDLLALGGVYLVYLVWVNINGKERQALFDFN
jgi:hypothetical protein